MYCDQLAITGKDTPATREVCYSENEKWLRIDKHDNPEMLLL